MKYARRRDACEKAIIQALRATGCSVQQLDGTGVPDLLVGYTSDEMPARLVLLECKDPDDGDRNSRSTGKKVANPLGLRETQWLWWQKWTGPKPFVVTTPTEALDAVFPERTNLKATTLNGGAA